MDLMGISFHCNLLYGLPHSQNSGAVTKFLFGQVLDGHLKKRVLLGWILRSRKRWRRWSGGHYGLLACQKSTVAALICQNDPSKEESFQGRIIWQNLSLVTHILFELWLSMYYDTQPSHKFDALPSKFKTCFYFKRAQNTILINCQTYFLILVSFFQALFPSLPTK